MNNQEIIKQNANCKNINARRFSHKVTGLLLLLGCALLHGNVNADVLSHAVGPQPAGNHDADSKGSLMVYSSTEPAQLGDGPAYYTHSAYLIYDSTGKQIKTVANHDDSTDETPQQVELKPGSYTVKAWSDKDGLVTVPVVIRQSLVTKVNLEGGRDSGKEVVDSKRAVMTASGQIVGWKA